MSDSPDHRPEVRIADMDRDRAAEVLREAHAQGRITVDELDERLTSVYSAKTFADLVPATHDLPAVGRADRRETPPAAGSAALPRFRMSLAILGGASRDGAWVVPPAYKAVATLGGIKLDTERCHLRGGPDRHQGLRRAGRHGDHRAGRRGGGGRRRSASWAVSTTAGKVRACPGDPDPDRRRGRDGRHRGQARPGNRPPRPELPAPG